MLNRIALILLFYLRPGHAEKLLCWRLWPIGLEPTLNKNILYLSFSTVRVKLTEVRAPACFHPFSQQCWRKSLLWLCRPWRSNDPNDPTRWITTIILKPNKSGLNELGPMTRLRGTVHRADTFVSFAPLARPCHVRDRAISALVRITFILMSSPLSRDIRLTCSVVVEPICLCVLCQRVHCQSVL